MTIEHAFLESMILASEVSSVQILAGARISDRFMVSGQIRSLNSAVALTVGGQFDSVIVYDSLSSEVRLIKGSEVPWLNLGQGKSSVKTLEDILGSLPVQSDMSTLLLVEDGDFLFEPSSGKIQLLQVISRLSDQILKTPSGKNILTTVLKFRNTCRVPAFLTANPLIRQIQIGQAGRDERAAFAESAAAAMPERIQTKEAVEKFAAISENMLLTELNTVVDLCCKKNAALADIEHIARGVRIGVADSPWAGENLRAALRKADDLIRKRVKGQCHVVSPTIQALKRAALNLSGAHSRSSQAPRLVLWLSGPTGTGKTELAKTIAELIFGDENAILRFDCAEFADAHSDARLIGSPPGYVGHESGGELTGAVWEKPFSVILLDEIEKAHPRILDKFLAILDDGRLSDGQGRTVNFSETVVIFSSNLGMDSDSNGGTYTLSTPFEKLESGVRNAVEDHFVKHLGRPELLGRIGKDNIFVFDFIRKDMAEGIMAKMIRQILVRTEENTGAKVAFSKKAWNELRELCLNDDILQLGGRGIAKKLEASFTTPLADALFDRLVSSPKSFRIDSVLDTGWKMEEV
jgi:ATP-dependent Clp protease ATP-binding subunit ClpA